MTAPGWRSAPPPCVPCWPRRSLLHPTTQCDPGKPGSTAARWTRSTRSMCLAQARQLRRPSCSAAFDALLLPTAPNTPTLAELAADPIGPNSRLGTWTNFVNLCDLAAWAVPAGIGRGRPAGGHHRRGAGLVGGAVGRPGGPAAPRVDHHDGRRHHRRRCRRPAAPDPAGPAGDGAVLRRRAYDRAAAEWAAHRARRPLRGGGEDPCPAYRLYALGNRPRHGGGTHGWRGNRRGESGRCRRRRSARCWPRCRRRSASGR